MIKQVYYILFFSCYILTLSISPNRYTSFFIAGLTSSSHEISYVFCVFFSCFFFPNRSIYLFFWYVFSDVCWFFFSSLYFIVYIYWQNNRNSTCFLLLLVYFLFPSSSYSFSFYVRVCVCFFSSSILGSFYFFYSIY